MTALEQFNTIMESETIDEPIERLRFFISLALTGQDWLDVEQFIDGVSQQLASREAEVAKLKDDNEYLYVAAIERDQLREQVKLLLESMDAINSTGIDRAPKWTGMSARDIARLALAATEPKP